MKKIMFNDRYGLTDAVLSGRKTQTRRICKHDRPDETYDIAFPIFEDKDFDDEGNSKSPLYGAFCWRNDAGAHTDWNVPKYKVGEVVAVAQSYKDIACGALLDDLKEVYRTEPAKLAGWTNKLFVCADLMLHRIRITNVRVERLQNISYWDCFKEGIYADEDPMNPQAEIFTFPNAPQWWFSPREAYAALIDRISGKGTWESNPWVFVYDF